MNKQNLRQEIEEELEVMIQPLIEGMENGIRLMRSALQDYDVNQWAGNALMQPEPYGAFLLFASNRNEAEDKGVNTENYMNAMRKVCRPYIDAHKYWITMIQTEAELNAGDGQ